MLGSLDFSHSVEQVTVFLQTVKSLCKQSTLVSITLPQTKLKISLHLQMRYKNDPFANTSGPKVE